MKVIILKDGKTARDVNPLGNNVDKYIEDNFHEQYIGEFEKKNNVAVSRARWQEAEAKLKTYEIDNIELVEYYHEAYKAGTTHEAELLPNNKLRIV